MQDMWTRQDNDRWQFVIEQGQEIDRDGFVHVEITKKENTYGVVIAGEAVYVTQANRFSFLIKTCPPIWRTRFFV